ncbi:MAG: ubiquinol-cytochrome c reductase iron-sulfur subunit [Pseudomonadota bacterium]
MSSEDVNDGRRRFLTGSFAVVGAAGALGAAIPFIKMWEPSAKAQAAGAPVEVNIGKLEPGQMLTTEWRGRPIWVVNRTPEMLEALGGVRDELRDPDSAVEQQPGYAQNDTRSLKPELLIVIGVCTHLGCSPKFIPEMEPQAFSEEWVGGFFCPCHSSKFDLAGRVFAGVPAPSNLEVPPHSYLDDERIVIGIDPEDAA